MHVVRIREGLYIQIPILLVLCDVISEAIDDGSIESFGLSVGLRVVRSCRQVLDA